MAWGDEEDEVAVRRKEDARREYEAALSAYNRAISNKEKCESAVRDARSRVTETERELEQARRDLQGAEKDRDDDIMREGHAGREIGGWGAESRIQGLRDRESRAESAHRDAGSALDRAEREWSTADSEASAAHGVLDSARRNLDN